MGNNNLVDIGKRIKEQRKKNKLTQEELAAQLLVDRVNVSYWEVGSRDIKTGDLIALAKALNTTSDYLLGLERGITPGISKVIEMLGLSEKTIDFLSDPKHQVHRDLVNRMIEEFAKEWR
jgi:transcriptional regulator with XRE-family HTH domain